MKSLAIGIASLLVTSFARADMDCSKGTPWRLPLPPSGWSTVESPIKLEGKAGQTILICNCTADAAGKTTGVWVRASSEITPDNLPARRQAAPKSGSPGGTHGYYLPVKSCTLASSATIILAPFDSSVETWGWFQAQP